MWKTHQAENVIQARFYSYVLEHVIATLPSLVSHYFCITADVHFISSL